MLVHFECYYNFFRTNGVWTSVVRADTSEPNGVIKKFPDKQTLVELMSLRQNAFGQKFIPFKMI